MELCTARGISNLLYHRPPPLPFASNHIRCLSQCRAPFLVHLKQTFFSSGPRYTIISCLSSTTEATTYEAASPEDTTTSPEDTTSEEGPPEEIMTEAAVPAATSTEVTSDVNDEPESNSVMAVEVVEPLPVEKEEEFINQPNELVPQEDDSLQLLKFLEDLNIKFDYEDKYSILTLGVGGLIALRIAVAVIVAIDSIPVLPKVLELVGLGYTIWFTTRYLIFEQNREEFVAKVKQLKEEVIG